MNTTFPTARPLRSRLSGAFLVVCVLVAAPATKAEAEYTFTLIADSTGPFKDFGAVASPALNAVGTVAFFANLDNGSRGVFPGSGGVITTITLTSLPFASFAYPSINQAGTVAFAAFPHSGFEPGIYAGNGGALITIAD